MADGGGVFPDMPAVTSGEPDTMGEKKAAPLPPPSGKILISRGAPVSNDSAQERNVILKILRVHFPRFLDGEAAKLCAMLCIDESAITQMLTDPRAVISRINSMNESEFVEATHVVNAWLGFVHAFHQLHRWQLAIHSWLACVYFACDTGWEGSANSLNEPLVRLLIAGAYMSDQEGPDYLYQRVDGMTEFGKYVIEAFSGEIPMRQSMILSILCDRIPGYGKMSKTDGMYWLMSNIPQIFDTSSREIPIWHNDAPNVRVALKEIILDGELLSQWVSKHATSMRFYVKITEFVGFDFRGDYSHVFIYVLCAYIRLACDFRLFPYEINILTALFDIANAKSLSDIDRAWETIPKQFENSAIHKAFTCIRASMLCDFA
ncbi:MAG: hypothetical protein LBF26_02240 [Puniceicoccales bacterium]|nr:hypothetical protein [Puniceicoccales bacterium]